MVPADFSFLARLVQRRAGLLLTESRRAPIELRLARVMRHFGLKDLSQVIGELKAGREALAEAVTEAMTVNESSFFRDPGVFRRLGTDILPALMRARARDKRLRIWSAACATGQEAYSLAMMLDNLGLAAQGWSIELSASDISADALARAERGYYSLFESQRGLSEGDLAVWFQPAHNGYEVAGHIRRMVSFRRFNLLDSLGWLDELDLVLCRNVLIHLHPGAGLQLLERIADAMAPDGVLVLGDTEAAPASLFTPMPGGDGIYAKTKVAAAKRLAAL